MSAVLNVEDDAKQVLHNDRLDEVGDLNKTPRKFCKTPAPLEFSCRGRCLANCARQGRRAGAESCGRSSITNPKEARSSSTPGRSQGTVIADIQHTGRSQGAVIVAGFEDASSVSTPARERMGARDRLLFMP
jgi:hypothetical protein